MIDRLLTKLFRSRWLNIRQVPSFGVFKDGNVVREERMRPIPSHLDQASLVNTGKMVIWKN